MLSHSPANSSTAAILTAASATPVAKPRVVELLAYNQDELLTSGNIDGAHCVGFTNFWLCLHMLDPAKTIDELVAKEPKKLQAMQENLNDILLLSKYLGSDAKIAKASAPVSMLGVKAFSKMSSDAIFEPGPKKRFLFEDCDYEAETSTARAKTFADAVKQILEQKSADKKYINFSYCWMDDVKPTDKDNVHPVTYLRIKGHSIAFIKDPTPDCELLFFDCNYYAYAFTKATDFYAFSHAYFKAVLGENRIPESFHTSIARRAPIKLPSIAAPAAVTAAPSPSQK